MIGVIIVLCFIFIVICNSGGGSSKCHVMVHAADDLSFCCVGSWQLLAVEDFMNLCVRCVCLCTCTYICVHILCPCCYHVTPVERKGENTLERILYIFCLQGIHTG